MRVLPAFPRQRELVDPKLRKLFTRLCRAAAPWPLFLFGPAGVGKTGAALCLADHFWGGTLYASLNDLADWTIDSLLCDTAGRWRWQAENRELVIIDELGARERTGDLHYSALKAVLDARELHAARVGVYLSNLAPEALAKLFDDRILSRLLAGSVYRLDGADRRRGR